MTSPSVLTLHGLVKRFGNFTAVDHLDLEITAGEIYALLGPNGAGKTTTIRMIMGMLYPDEGEIALWGQPPRQARARVGYLPEARGLYRNARVNELLTYLGALKGLPVAKARQNAEKWLARFDLTAWAHRKVHELSHGMQQKVQLAAALLPDPPLLIFDEPFQGLDPVNVQMVKQLIAELREEGRTVLLSSHQLHQVERLADRIALIHQGRIVESGPLNALRQRYARGEIAVTLAAGATLPARLPRVDAIHPKDDGWLLVPSPDASPQDILETLVAQKLPVTSFEVVLPTLEEIFLQAVQTAGATPEG